MIDSSPPHTRTHNTAPQVRRYRCRLSSSHRDGSNNGRPGALHPLPCCCPRRPTNHCPPPHAPPPAALPPPGPPPRSRCLPQRCLLLRVVRRPDRRARVGGVGRAAAAPAQPFVRPRRLLLILLLVVEPPGFATACRAARWTVRAAAAVGVAARCSAACGGVARGFAGGALHPPNMLWDGERENGWTPAWLNRIERVNGCLADIDRSGRMADASPSPPLSLLSHTQDDSLHVWAEGKGGAAPHAFGPWLDIAPFTPAGGAVAWLRWANYGSTRASQVCMFVGPSMERFLRV